MLRYALLALLSRRPLSGYDLTQRFYGSVAFCWHAHPSQIYSELKALEGAGWVAAKAEPGGSRPRRKTFTISEPGLQALVTWLRRPESVLALNDEWLIRFWAVDLLDSREARELLTARRRLHEERLAAYRALLRTLRREHGSIEQTDHETLVGPYLCLQQGLWHEEMYIRWCRWAGRRLQARQRTRRPRSDSDTVDLHTVVKLTRRRATA
jgi:DNA-binding PadR family transcriptional regulator